MSRFARAGLILALLGSGIPGASRAQVPTAATSGPPQILVSANGEVRLQPDRATIMFSVETRAQSAAVAAAENAKRQKAVMDALRAKTGGRDVLSTVGYSVTSDDRYDSGQRKTVGYIARNTVVLETQAIEKIGSFIDTALFGGSNLISGLRFWSSNADQARRQALAQAVASARADAEAMAKAAGGSLGAVLELQTVSSGGPVAMEAMAMRAAAVETPIAPPEQVVSATISARWAFISGKN